MFSKYFKVVFTLAEVRKTCMVLGLRILQFIEVCLLELHSICCFQLEVHVL